VHPHFLPPSASDRPADAPCLAVPGDPRWGTSTARGSRCTPERDQNTSHRRPQAQAPSDFMVRPQIPRSLIRHQILIMSYQSEIQRVRIAPSIRTWLLTSQNSRVGIGAGLQQGWRRRWCWSLGVASHADTAKGPAATSWFLLSSTPLASRWPSSKSFSLPRSRKPPFWRCSRIGTLSWRASAACAGAGSWPIRSAKD
jgi:hypothetical protein